MIKYIISYYIEILHRYCFDNIYVQNYKNTILSRFICRIFDFCYFIIPDYREYLNKYYYDRRTKYLRYKQY